MTKLIGMMLVGLLTCSVARAQAAGTSAAAQSRDSITNSEITNGPVAEYVTDSACTIGWSTTVPGKMTVRYGTDPKKMSQTVESVEGRDPRNHHVQLTGLSSDTRYFFQVVANGEPLRSAGTFTTVGKGESPTKSKAIIPE